VLANAGVQVQGLAGRYDDRRLLLAPGRGGHSLDADGATDPESHHIQIPGSDRRGERPGHLRSVEIGVATQYAAEDAHVTWLLKDKIEEEKRADADAGGLYRELELPLLCRRFWPRWSDTAWRSTRIISPHSRTKWLPHRVAQREIYEAAGGTFNLNKHPATGRSVVRKTGIQAAAQDEDRLLDRRRPFMELLAEQGHAVPRLLLDLPRPGQTEKHYIDALPRLVHPATGRIHTSFNQTITATPAVLRAIPNLQNIPFRTEEGRRIRWGFVPAPGRVLLAADYSQIELRLAAHLSGDENHDSPPSARARTFTPAPGRDHGRAARMVDKQMRAMAKTVNFACCTASERFSAWNAIWASGHQKSPGFH
jgi:DNA polymerase-1